jgi:hypothetical protein
MPCFDVGGGQNVMASACCKVRRYGFASLRIVLDAGGLNAQLHDAIDGMRCERSALNEIDSRAPGIA